ncbi:TPA: hypothetical protein ACY37E_001226 [Pasteurella multocida]|uniref:hypothetical protein n=1 Tax=Pasteurella multocida TaxID=747 RepID=UPI0009F63898|nr:hypothetical protein [Pasteurella multocida]QDA13757.1 hypothetical protein E0Z11_01550 [Pasteurella multocida subsp. multocida]MCL7818584.1 hypothetical protein [Pasteurella multocida]PNM01866.1 hypothetical protein A6J89_012140 [Pasteurella multocida]PNM02798.1 hypothetical protein A6J89_002975 [Pasteurella multocida]QGV30739.1 hypothetical protein PmCQ2_003685 [Pasteurella multocida]
MMLGCHDEIKNLFVYKFFRNFRNLGRIAKNLLFFKLLCVPKNRNFLGVFRKNFRNFLGSPKTGKMRIGRNRAKIGRNEVKIGRIKQEIGRMILYKLLNNNIFI